MISVDSNVFVDFFRGTKNKAVDYLQKTLDEKQLLMNPFVLSELLSSPKLPKKTEKYLLALPRIEIGLEFFEKAGLLSRQIQMKGKGVSMADVYIAQACIDAEIPLLTNDKDHTSISEYSELKVVEL